MPIESLVTASTRRSNTPKNLDHVDREPLNP